MEGSSPKSAWTRCSYLYLSPFTLQAAVMRISVAPAYGAHLKSYEFQWSENIYDGLQEGRIDTLAIK